MKKRYSFKYLAISKSAHTKHAWSSAYFLTACLSLWLASCTTVSVDEKAPLPEVPEYVKVPHPAGYDMADLKAVMMSPLAPTGVQGDFANTCDSEFKSLLQASSTRDDQKRGAEELVTNDPQRMHWCFYTKLSKLDEIVSSDATWSTRQKAVMDTYAFLSPIANAYVEVYQDSRYLRWAALYYTKISEWVFFRKVKPSEENSLLMVNTQRSDLEPWVPAKTERPAVSSVFEKYGIGLAPVALEPEANRKPAEATITNLNQVMDQAPPVEVDAPKKQAPPANEPAAPIQSKDSVPSKP